jgi:hypothetical protein
MNFAIGDDGVERKVGRRVCGGESGIVGVRREPRRSRVGAR